MTSLHCSASDRSKINIKTETIEIPSIAASPTSSTSSIRKWTSILNRVADRETQGIERVDVESRQPARPGDYTHVFLLWLNASLTPNNILVGLYGPTSYGLDLTTASILGGLGTILGSIVVAYMSIWGPRSGHRTLVVTRYFFGYYPTKICCLLNLITSLGYGMVNCILGGQIIFTISKGQTTVPIGIIIVAILTWCIATFGMHLFHLYSRYAWILSLIILCIMVGCAGPSFNSAPHLSPNIPPGTPAHRLAFFSLCFASAATWAPSAADYFVYFPPSINRTYMFLSAIAGISLSMTLTTVLGIGLATGLYTNPTWMSAWLTSPGSLIANSFSTLQGFGSFCAAILVISVVSNNIPCTYSAGLNLQMLGHYGTRIPRSILTTLEVVVYTVSAIVARNYLREIMDDFLSLMSYWIGVWLAIVLAELAMKRVVFHHRQVSRDYDWDAWDDPAKLPSGWAATGSFILGCLAAVMGMHQSYFVGPVAQLLQPPNECDLGVWLAFGCTVLVYPPLRAVELSILGR